MRLPSLSSVDARVVLAAIVLLAIAVRVAALWSRVHVDDAYSWLVASQPSPHAFLRQLAASENTPPLFYLLLTPLPIGDPAWLRLPAVVPGILLSPVLYVAARPALGTRSALLAALAVAVSPFLISYSDLGRGFMLADLALLVALWAMLRLGEQSSRGWWALYLLAGVVAVYTEFNSVIFLVALTAAATVWADPARRIRVAVLGALPLVSLVPWIPEIVRGQHQVHLTKLDPPLGTATPVALGDAVVKLTLGEHGGTGNAAGRWLLFVLLCLVAGAAGAVLRRHWNERDPRWRYAIKLIAATGALTLAGHAVAAVIGVHVFTQRYMTILIPLGAALAAAALVCSGKRTLVVAAAVLLVALGLAGFVRRYQAQFEPDFKPVAVAAQRLHPRSVLTNTPIVLYYLASLKPQLDRPSNLGPGRARSCLRPCLIIDDTRVHGGRVRRLPGARRIIKPFVLTVER